MNFDGVVGSLYILTGEIEDLTGEKVRALALLMSFLAERLISGVAQFSSPKFKTLTLGLAMLLDGVLFGSINPAGDRGTLYDPGKTILLSLRGER